MQPDGNYWYAEQGEHIGQLTGPADADFDLYLYTWSDGRWNRVASSTSATSAEEIVYDGGAAYYVWTVTSYSGSGDYELLLQRP